MNRLKGIHSLFRVQVLKSNFIPVCVAAVPTPANLKRRQSGFTQSDLVLTLAALFFLVCVAIPMVSRSRENSRRIQCEENLRKVTGAILKYAEEHDHRVPQLKNSPPPGGWWYYKEEVKGYLGLTGPSSAQDKVFACPSDRGFGLAGEPIQPFWKSPKHDFTSYVLNGVDLPGIPNIAGRELSSIQDPAKTLLVMEWSAHGPLSWHRSKTGLANAPFYDGAENVVGYVDGHVSLTRFHYDGINAAYTRDPVPGYDYKFSGD